MNEQEKRKNSDIYTERRRIIEKFIERLDNLDKGEKAILKRSAGLRISEAKISSLPVFYKALPYSQNVWQEELWFLVATVKQLNNIEWKKEKEMNFGDVLLRIRKTDSFDSRVRNLLECGYKDGDKSLGYKLRQVVKMAKDEGAAIDYVALLEDLLDWDNETKRIQKKWGKAYFMKNKENNEEE
jgi:CRISPR type I-E-associated protein CasB/Cse2